MSASLNLTGLRELAKSLEVLPAGLEDAAGKTVRAAAFATAQTLGSALPLGPTGNLRGRVRVKTLDATRYQVISGAPHAWINEEGTRLRKNKAGANRGKSPASKIVAGVASDHRREMNNALERVLVSVLGDVR